MKIVQNTAKLIHIKSIFGQFYILHTRRNCSKCQESTRQMIRSPSQNLLPDYHSHQYLAHTSYTALTTIGTQSNSLSPQPSTHLTPPRYRTSTLKSRIIPLSPAFLSYLREDGIVLPSETPTFPPPSSYTDNSTSTGWDSDPDPDPSLEFPEIHQQIKDTIFELGGLVAPKLNWSAPKDATWISITKNSMECATPNDIYLLLKSSDFITHDLEHAFDSCSSPESSEDEAEAKEIQYVLVLRKWFKVNPSCEFRCFVRDRTLIGICQRDLNHFAFLFPMQNQLLHIIQSYFESTLQNTFPDENFVFDIYIPEPYDKVRLMDINPWAPHTDPLLFSWLELLTLQLPTPLLGTVTREEPSVRFYISPRNGTLQHTSDDSATETEAEGAENEDEDVEDIPFIPELRLVKKDDPEAYSFASAQYSAHKLPREVVEAGMSGESGMREFADQWKRMMSGEGEMQRQGGESSDEEADEDEVETRGVAGLSIA